MISHIWYHMPSPRMDSAFYIQEMKQNECAVREKKDCNKLANLLIEGVFGWAVAVKKSGCGLNWECVLLGCGCEEKMLWNVSREKVDVGCSYGKVESRLVKYSWLFGNSYERTPLNSLLLTNEWTPLVSVIFLPTANLFSLPSRAPLHGGGGARATSIAHVAAAADLALACPPAADLARVGRRCHQSSRACVRGCGG